MAVDILLSKNNEQKKISLGLLFPSPLNSYEMNGIEELASNIRACGLLTPLTVAGPFEGGKFEILSGERRFRAIQLIQKDTPGFIEEVPCYIVGDSSMDAATKELVIEFSNSETRDEFNREQHRFRVMQLLKQLVETSDMNERKIASTLAKVMRTSKRYGRMYASIFRDGTDDLQRAVMSTTKTPNDDGEPVHIPTSIASRVSKLPEQEQAEVIARVNTGEKPIDALNSVRKKSTDLDERKGAEKKTESWDFEHDDDENALQRGGAETSDSDLFSAVAMSVQNGEDIDLDGYDAMGAFRRQSSSVDLNLDTSGRLKTLKSSESKSEEYRIIKGWIERMNRTLDHEEDIEPEDMALFEDFAALYEKYNQ